MTNGLDEPSVAQVEEALEGILYELVAMLGAGKLEVLKTFGTLIDSKRSKLTSLQ